MLAKPKNLTSFEKKLTCKLSGRFFLVNKHMSVTTKSTYDYKQQEETPKNKENTESLDKTDGSTSTAKQKTSEVETTETRQAQTTRPLISLIVPCYNEEENIEHTYQAIANLWQDPKTGLDKYDLELIFVDDGSKDATVWEIEKVAKKDSRVCLLEFSRNFGKEIATTAGISLCRGDACIVVDADLQYPIEKIPEFINKWKRGAKVVVGIRDKKQTNNLVDKIGSYLFYKIINKISETPVLPGALDFRLIDREVIEQFKRFTERRRMTRALIDWLGYKRDYVYYKEKPRLYGQPSYSFVKRVSLALNTFVGLSLFPLKLAGYLGILVILLSGLLGLFSLFNQFIWPRPNYSLTFSGTFLIGLLLLFLNGITLSCLGLIALYIANIHTEVTNRPLYVLKKRSP